MARTVTDLARLLSIQAGYDARAPLSIKDAPARFEDALKVDLKGASLAWLGDYRGYLTTETGVLDLCRTALRDVEAIGCRVEEAVPEHSPAELWETWLTLRHFAVAGNLGPLYADPAKRAWLKPEAVWEIEGGLKLSGEAVWRASIRRSAWYAALLKLFERYDYLALPSAQVFPFDADCHWPQEIAGRTMDTYHRWMEVVIGATLAGLPVVCVPAGFSAQGLPLGLQILGKPQGDRAVLQLAFAYEQATQWVRKRPPQLAGGAQ